MRVLLPSNNMKKNEIVGEIQQALGCDKNAAERVFHRALQDKAITARVNWERIVGVAITLAVVVTGAWAAWQHVG